MDKCSELRPNPVMNDDTTREGGQSPARYSRTRVEQDFLEAFESFGSRAFFDYLERYLRSDGVMVCNCPPQLLQIGGTHRGYDDVVTALRSFFIEFRVLATSVDDIVIDGAHVVINYHMQLSHVGTGRTGRVSGINHYVLDADRKISKCSIFLDNASLAVIGDVLDTFADIARGMADVRKRRDDDDVP